jgi:hypothetical protein
MNKKRQKKSNSKQAIRRLLTQKLKKKDRFNSIKTLKRKDIFFKSKTKKKLTISEKKVIKVYKENKRKKRFMTKTISSQIVPIFHSNYNNIKIGKNTEGFCDDYSIIAKSRQHSKSMVNQSKFKKKLKIQKSRSRLPKIGSIKSIQTFKTFQNNQLRRHMSCMNSNFIQSKSLNNKKYSDIKSIDISVELSDYFDKNKSFLSKDSSINKKILKRANTILRYSKMKNEQKKRNQEDFYPQISVILTQEKSPERRNSRTLSKFSKSDSKHISPE